MLAAEAWLEGKIKDDAARLAEAEAKVDAERRAAPPPPAAADGQGAATTDLETRLAAARAAEATAAGKAADLRRLAQEGRLADAPPALADDALRRLLDRRAAVRAEIADASRRAPSSRAATLWPASCRGSRSRPPPDRGRSRSASRRAIRRLPRGPPTRSPISSSSR